MELRDVFLRLCRERAKQKDALYGEEVTDKYMTGFSMYYRTIRVELVYSRKWEVLAPPSVMYARFYLNKNNPVYLHLPELIAYLGRQDYRCCYFPYIESAQRMKDCFASLTQIVDAYIPLAEKLGTTGEDVRIMRHWAAGGFYDATKAKAAEAEKQIDWETMALTRRLQEGIEVSRYTDLDAYQAFVNGDRERAIRKYEKLRKNGLSLYEKGLLEFLRSAESKDFVPMPPQCCAVKKYKSAEKGDKTDLKGFVLLYGIFSLFFCGLLEIINLVLSYKTLYYYGIEWWFGFLLALVPAGFCYVAFQRWIRRKLGGDTDFYDIQKNTIFTQRFAGVAFAVFMAACVVFCFAVTPMSSRFYDTHAIYYTEEDGAVRFDYAQVTQVCRVSARYNDYGDRVNRASYVLILDDGRKIDLDCDGSVKQQLAMVQDLFSEVPIQTLDSDRDLP